MLGEVKTLKFDAATPANTTAAISGSVDGFEACDSVHLIAKVVAPTNGALDVWLQEKIESDTWVEYFRLPTTAAGTTVYYRFELPITNSAAVGKFNDAGTGTAVLGGATPSVGGSVGGLPDATLRVYVKGDTGTVNAGHVTLWFKCKGKIA